MVYCAVYGCGHVSEKDGGKIKFYRFPTVPQDCPSDRKELISIRRTLWLLRICRQDLDDEKVTRCSSRVCSSHFLSGAPAILEDADNLDWAPSLNLGHDYFDGKRKLRKRKDKNNRKCPCLCDAYSGHKKHKREKNSSKKNIISDNKTSSTNTAVVSKKSIQSEILMSSSEATMSSSESRTSHTSNSSALMKKYPRKSRYCRFRGCNYTSDFIGVHFYRFPRDEKRCREWVKASKNEKLTGVSASELNQKAHLCMHHFQDWCFFNTTTKHRLVHNAIPGCSKLNATKKIASTKAPNSTDSTVTNDADNNSSVHKKLLISPVSSQAPSTVSEDSSSDSEDIPLIPIKSGNSTILRYFPPEDAHIRTIQSDGASTTIVTPEKIALEEDLLTTIKSEDTSADAKHLENMQENNLSENQTELVQSTYTNSFSEPSNSCESEHINCVSHLEAFNAAKTLLHYLMNQNDVDNPDINFLLNLTKKIKRRLPEKNETISENS